MVSGDRTHRALDLLSFAVPRQWQAAAQVGLLDPCIPLNKVCHRSFDLGGLGHTRFCGSAIRRPVRLSWREPKMAMTRSIQGSLNKVCCSGFLWLWSVAAVLSLLAGRGGEELGWCGVPLCSFGGSQGVRDTAILWRSSSAALAWLPTQGAGGQQLQALALALRQVLINLLWRPFVGLARAHHFSAVPSGFVPGTGGEGRRLRPELNGGVGGPDCVLFFLCRVCSVIVEDLVQFVSFSEVLLVICTAPLLF